MIKRPGKTASKDAVFAAFDQLLVEYKKLADGGAPVAAAAPAKTTTKTSTPDGDAMAGQSIEGTISNLIALRDSFGNAVSTLSTRLTTEASRLQDLQTQATELSDQLKELHGLEVADNTLQAVIEEYQNKSVSFQKDLKEKQENFERGIAARALSWKTEQEEYARATKERDDSLKKTRQRNAEEYNYNLDQARKSEADAYAQTRLQVQRELDATIAAKEKLWAEKEKQVSEQETLYNTYKADHDALPTKLNEALKKAKTDGQNIANSQTKTKADLIAKETEGERRIYELQIKNLEASIKERSHQLEALSQQLAQALKQGQDLAVKAIEGASNASSFGAVKEIALEQAKNLPKK
jgi:chromosome segregation ATPase